jgi:nitrogenase delta subunit
MDDQMKDRIAKLEDYIMKRCLWQFHSRAWDRKDQNEGVLTKATQILCGEPVELETPADKCYWVDAAFLAKGYKNRFAWLSTMSREEIKLLMQGLKDRLDFVLVTGSLNKELIDPHY